MKYKLGMAGIIMLLVSRVEAAVPRPQRGEESIWTSPLACLLYGLVLGITAGILFMYLKKGKRGKQENNAAFDRKIKEAGSAAKVAEQELLRKERALAACQSENLDLKRKADELEQLILPTSTERAAVDVAPEAAPVDVISAPLYFLQPTRDGRFMEAGAMQQEAEALYVLQRLPGNPNEATLQFIDTPNNVALALPNEASWILVACERSNIATQSSRSIRTDRAGRVILRDGEWVIVQKAKISYQ